MANVTYLFGAGASANCIPIVNNIGERFGVIIKELRKFSSRKNQIPIFSSWPTNLKNHINQLDGILENLEWLEKESRKHQTIDTLAKKYYLADSNLLNKLKETLIQYFIIEQVLFIRGEGDSFIKKREYRYDSFFAALLDKTNNGLRVKNNIKIVTWNYDQQIELALRTFTSTSLKRVKEEFQILPNQSTISNSGKPNFDFNQFGCLKLNGNAIWSQLPMNGSDEAESSLDYFGSDDSTIEFLLGQILKEKSEMKSFDRFNHIQNSIQQMNFSWEEDVNFSNKYLSFDSHRKLVEEIASQTDYLVIIGYSYPVFNRNVDKTFIENLHNVKKIYIQDPNCEAIKQTLSTGFKNISLKVQVINEFFHLQTDTRQFLIPFEVN